MTRQRDPGIVPVRRAAAYAGPCGAATLLAVAGAVAALWLGVAEAHEPDAEEAALISLVDAELAFAHMAYEQGVGAAFLANFSPDGIVLEPAPVPLRDAVQVRSAPADPKASRVAWKPAQVGVARSNDMGYTSGPFKRIDTALADGARPGVYFSIWRRDANRSWRVVLNVSTVTPDTVDFVPFGEAPRPHYAGPPDVKAQRRHLLSREARAFTTVRGDSSLAAYAALLAPDARLYRDGMAPLAGRVAVADFLGATPSRVTLSPTDVRVSAPATWR